ncbi:unnamed protein product [Dracunculus medinensis]|uniref:G_PROTEIN_RECEP_F1_2 domain-containing protein n=1 Tax=Dracunculus medinensis TaxID=318479 RepID=A0A158Q4Q8_DRAME|nr:unnamed protein product [Dracunculus medinensis]
MESTQPLSVHISEERYKPTASNDNDYGIGYPENNYGYSSAQISYIIESAIYALAMILGFGACVYTARRFHSKCRRHVVLAARLMRFKISLTVADLIVLFVYAPTQIIWIGTYNWYGGDILCRTTKFINTFSLHLTANMQVLIAADRLYITAHLRTVHQKSRFAASRIIALAWLLAFTCAFPQLLVFHVYFLPNGKPQCVSIWTVIRFQELLNQESAEMYNESNAYNVLHLFSIYILPYWIELFCYAAILILMKRFHADIHKKPKKISKWKINRFFWNSPSRPSSNVPLNNYKSFKGRKARSRDTITVLCPSEINLMQKTASEIFERHRYQSAPCVSNNINDFNSDVRGSKVAWRNTVALARRKTRRKAFLMLTLNMIFWTPYCAMGLLSTVMVFDHSGYDFVNALVVLNAVSNLLL